MEIRLSARKVDPHVLAGLFAGPGKSSSESGHVVTLERGRDNIMGEKIVHQKERGWADGEEGRKSANHLHREKII